MTIHPSSAGLVREVARESFSPEPPHVLGAIMARRAAGERVILPAGPAPAGTRGVAVRWAAGLLFVAAGAAAAMPGSPLRRVVMHLFNSTRVPTTVLRPPPVTRAVPTPQGVTDTPRAGVSIPARSRPMWVAIDSVSARARVVLHFSGGPELEVLGLAGAATATFRPREDGISVAQLRGGELRINVPRQTSSFSLLVRGVEVAGAAAGRFRGGGSDSLVIVARP